MCQTASRAGPARLGRQARMEPPRGRRPTPRASASRPCGRPTAARSVHYHTRHRRRPCGQRRALAVQNTRTRVLETCCDMRGVRHDLTTGRRITLLHDLAGRARARAAPVDVAVVLAAVARPRAAVKDVRTETALRTARQSRPRSWKPRPSRDDLDTVAPRLRVVSVTSSDRCAGHAR